MAATEPTTEFQHRELVEHLARLKVGLESLNALGERQLQQAAHNGAKLDSIYRYLQAGNGARMQRRLH